MGIVDRSTTVGPVLETIDINLKNFKEFMDLKKGANEETWVKGQMLMLATLRLIFRQTDHEDFAACFGKFLEFVKAEASKEGVLNNEARYRGLHLCRRMGTKDQSAVILIVGLACMISDDKARAQVLGRFDFNRLDVLWPNGDHGDKLRNYFAAL